MKKTNGNAKFIWIVLFAIITIILCYLFIVVHFFYIDTTNISLKFKLWPFLSEKQVCQIYEDAVVDIHFTKIDDKNFDKEIDTNCLGVNIRRDGYVLTLYNNVRDCDENTEFKIFTSAGKIFDAQILYNDKDLNLSVLKCLDDDKKIELPFVNVGEVSNTDFSQTDVVMINNERKSSVRKTLECDFSIIVETKIEEDFAVDFVAEHAFSIEAEENDPESVVFDFNGNLLGFGMPSKEQNLYVFCAEGANSFINNVVHAYNDNSKHLSLLEKIEGFDLFELASFYQVAAQNQDPSKFYLFGKLYDFDQNMQSYLNASLAISGFYLCQDFSFEGEKILSKGTVICEVKSGSQTCEIDSRFDLAVALNKIGREKTVEIGCFNLSTYQKNTIILNLEEIL